MSPDDPRHGTPAGFYAHRADDETACDPCGKAIFRHHKQWRQDYDRGQRWTTSAQPVTEHIKHLEQTGMSPSEIWKAAGISRTLFYRIRNDLNLRCRLVTARAVLAVQPTDRLPSKLTPGQFVSGVGTRRRIRALLAIGWSHREMRARSRVLTAVTLNQKGDMVTRSMHERVAALYNELSMTPGPSDRTRARAAALGYASPLAWDDDAIDDPKARPAGVRGSGRPHRHEVDEVAVLRAMRGDRTINLTKAERAEVSRRLRADGWSFARIEAHTGLKADRYVGVAA